MDIAAGTPLFDAVTAAVGGTVSAVEDVVRSPLDYDAFLAHREVNRIQGTAITAAGVVRWSMVEKVTEGPDLAIPYLTDNGEREFAAYASGLLEDLAPRIRAPRALGALREEGGRMTLWLEEVHHAGPRPLDAESLLLAARDLGGLAGRWLGAVPEQPWLFRNWITRHSQPEAVEEGLSVLRRARPAAVARMGHQIPESIRLVEDQPRLWRILESLPTTLCHHDAVGANVFRTPDATVLIDWESVGPGPVGADLASLLFSSPRRGDASAVVAAAVLETAFDAYVEGFRSAGGGLDVSTIRLGFDAANGLRWKLARDVAATIEVGGAPRRGSRPDESAEEALDELIILIDVLLASAERALR